VTFKSSHHHPKGMIQFHLQGKVDLPARPIVAAGTPVYLGQHDHQTLAIYRDFYVHANTVHFLILTSSCCKSQTTFTMGIQLVTGALHGALYTQ